jgi:hypothetical protein
MGPGSEDRKTTLYFPPTLTKLTPNQARKLVADRTYRDQEEAGKFLESLRQQEVKKKDDQPLGNAQDDNRKRSA